VGYLLGYVTQDLRALLVAAHLIIISLQAFPAPVGGNLSATRNASGLVETFEGLSSVTGVPAEELSERTADGVDRWLKARTKLLKPLRPYYKWAGTVQSWRMMSIINRKGARLRIELDGELAYRTVDPAARWRADVLESARIRGLIIKYSWRMNRKDYRLLVDWLAAEARSEFGEDVDVRVCLERYTISLPGEPARKVRCIWEELR